MEDVLESDRCAQLLKAIADPDRLRIVQCLRAGPHTVGEVVNVFPVHFLPGRAEATSYRGQIIPIAVMHNTYIGYFENQHGEQWKFTCNQATGEAVLRGRRYWLEYAVAGGRR